MASAPLLFDLAVLYRAFSFGADADLDPSETRAVRDALLAWAPGEDPARVDHAMREAELANVGSHALDAVIERVAFGSTQQERERVLADLRTIAEADGRVTGGERGMLARVEAAFDG